MNAEMLSRVLTISELAKISGYSAETVLHELETSRKGLSVTDYRKRLSECGANVLVQRKFKPWWTQLLSGFLDPMTMILIITGILSYFLDDRVNAVLIVAMGTLSVVLNFLQERQASRAAEALMSSVALTTTVIRNGETEVVKPETLVPGEIVSLKAGDLVPADGRVIEATDCHVNQASLTGESFPVMKTADPLDGEGGSLTDFQNMVFSGSGVVTGSMKVVIVSTGRRTQFGQIAHELAGGGSQNDFAKGIKQFSKLILRIVVVFVVIIFFANLYFERSMIDSFTFAVALAVGLVPEFLPMIMSVTMSKGASNMAKVGVIVKKLSAIPTFGSMDILCTDKTGTLTQDKIALVKYVDIKGDESLPLLRYAYINSSLQSSISNPLDSAIQAFKSLSIDKVKKIAEFPFDFERRRMSVVYEENNKRVIVTKGAPEEVMAVCNTAMDMDSRKKVPSGDFTEPMKLYHSLSKQGYRVLAVAIKSLGNKQTKWSKTDETEMTLVGFIGFLDPVKPEAKSTLAALQAIHIEMKVITGDNELVAQKVCRDAGIDIKGLLMGGSFDAIPENELAKKIESTTIFARFSPAQKKKVIETLRKNNHVVGYMGDGINDAPSLKAADIGISVSNAVDVARETAHIVLTHKSLMELVRGVKEGRRTFSNTMKYIQMGISSNFGNMFSFMFAVFFLPYLPILPVQILLNNFLYDFSQLTIPFDTVDEDELAYPRRWNMGMIRDYMLSLGPISSLFDIITFVILYNALTFHWQFRTGWFIESLATQTLVIHFIRTKKIPFIQSRPHRWLLLSTLMVVAVGWLLPYTPLAPLFSLYKLPWESLGIIGLVVVGYLLSIELYKQFFYRHYKAY